MRILEVSPNVKPVSEVKLGDELELRIDVNRPYSEHTFANRHRRRRRCAIGLIASFLFRRRRDAVAGGPLGRQFRRRSRLVAAVGLERMSAGTVDVPRVDVHAAQLDGRPVQSVPVPVFARAPVQPYDDVLRSDV